MVHWRGGGILAIVYRTWREMCSAILPLFTQLLQFLPLELFPRLSQFCRASIFPHFPQFWRSSFFLSLTIFANPIRALISAFAVLPHKHFPSVSTTLAL
jgi:hypothetical protein